MTDREAHPEEGPEAMPAPPRPPRTSRRTRVRRALSSRPQLRDMVIVQEVLSPPLGLRDPRD